MGAMLVLARIFSTAHLALMRMFLSYFLNITILDYYTVNPPKGPDDIQAKARSCRHLNVNSSAAY